MEKSLYNLCLEVFKIFDKEKVLDKLVLVGSWCIPFYKDYFGLTEYPILRTRDIDFLISNPKNIAVKCNIPKELKKIGFVDRGCYTLDGEYITKLQHPNLIVEFLTPETGRGNSGHPCNIPQLSINAQPLRFLDMLTKNTITVNIEKFLVTLPHPAYFGIHKLIIATKRENEIKRKKDKRDAILVLKQVIKINQRHIIRQAYLNCFKKSQNKIRKLLEAEKESEILELL